MKFQLAGTSRVASFGSRRDDCDEVARVAQDGRTGLIADRIDTVANGVTLVRTTVAVVLGVIALTEASWTLLTIAYATYWLGDMLDGWTARRLGQETRLGAVFDIVSDRACTSVLCACLLTLRPDLAVVLAPFLLSFMVLDTLLSLSFLSWPILGPNDFATVDRLVYRLNWSPLAKATNTAAVVVTSLAGLRWPALALVVLLMVVKAWSFARVHRLAQGADQSAWERS